MDIVRIDKAGDERCFCPVLVQLTLFRRHQVSAKAFTRNRHSGNKDENFVLKIFSDQLRVKHLFYDTKDLQLGNNAHYLHLKTLRPIVFSG